MTTTRAERAAREEEIDREYPALAAVLASTTTTETPGAVRYEISKCLAELAQLRHGVGIAHERAETALTKLRKRNHDLAAAADILEDLLLNGVRKKSA